MTIKLFIKSIRFHLDIARNTRIRHRHHGGWDIFLDLYYRPDYQIVARGDISFANTLHQNKGRRCLGILRLRYGRSRDRLVGVA